MLALSDITFEFGNRKLFDNASWHIHDGQKIGLIGPNGSGKTTLLGIIAGDTKISGGEITGKKNMRIGFLNQEHLSTNTGKTVLETIMMAFAEENKLAEEIEQLLEIISHDYSEENLHKLSEKQTAFEALDGYNAEFKAVKILEGLGFDESDFNRAIETFSGGWRMRIMLGRMLLERPDLLLLDEPTNHLDLPTIQWLETYLTDYPGTVIIVSHDRIFLDKVVNVVAELSTGKIDLYKGNYSFYEIEKQARNEIQKSRFLNQQAEIAQQQKFIDRFRAKASKASSVQSRVKALDRMERIDDVDSARPVMHLKLETGMQPGKDIAKLSIKSKKYPGIDIFQASTAYISRGEKIALVGANGKGKSTLLKMLSGKEPFEGEAKWGHNVVNAYFAQHQLESLNPAHEILTELRHEAPDKDDTYLRTLLGALLFTGDDVFKKIKVLSGGEKSRVALAKTLLAKANFLLLDEPTNHLDIQSVDILAGVLQRYEGTFLLVSHDRHLVSLVADKIWYIENLELKEYPGPYAEFEEWYSRKTQKTNPIESASKQKDTVKPNKSVKEKDVDKEIQLEIKNLIKQIEKSELIIAELENVRDTIAQRLENVNPQTSTEDLTKTGAEFQETELKINTELEKWEILNHRLNHLENTNK